MIEENAFIVLPEQIQDLEDKIILELIQSNDLSIPEIDLFKCLSQFKDKYMKYVRFGLIDKDDLENIVFPSNFVSTDIIKKSMDKNDGSYLFKNRVDFTNTFTPFNTTHYEVKSNKYTRSNDGHYANITVYSAQLPPKIYIEVKIIKVVQVVGYSIGITKQKGNSYEKDICVSPSGSRYNCSGSGSVNCSSGDNIGIDFDKSRGTVEFYLNGKKTGLSSNIDKTLQYYVCVHTRSPNDSFEIYVKKKP